VRCRRRRAPRGFGLGGRRPELVVAGVGEDDLELAETGGGPRGQVDRTLSDGDAVRLVERNRVELSFEEDEPGIADLERLDAPARGSISVISPWLRASMPCASSPTFPRPRCIETETGRLKQAWSQLISASKSPSSIA
jgi:hypothetical protein